MLPGEPDLLPAVLQVARRKGCLRHADTEACASWVPQAIPDAFQFRWSLSWPDSAVSNLWFVYPSGLARNVSSTKSSSLVDIQHPADTMSSGVCTGSQKTKDLYLDSLFPICEIYSFAQVHGQQVAMILLANHLYRGWWA